MSLLLSAEKLRRKLDKAEAKLQKAKADYAETVKDLRSEAGDEVCCLLDSATNLGKAAE